MMIRSYQLNLSVLSFASLFVGMFLVYSLVALNAASRRHELAVLRATGASAYHVFFVFLAEGAFMGIAGWLVAIPLGLLIGYGLCAYLAFQFDTDLYRVPLVLGINVYALAALVVILSALVSGAMIWRNLAHLDMVAVLKTKE